MCGSEATAGVPTTHHFIPVDSAQYLVCGKFKFCFQKVLGILWGRGKYFQLQIQGSDYTNRNLFLYSAGGCNSEIKVPVWLVFGEDNLPGLHMAASLCPLVAFPWHVSTCRETLSSLSPIPDKAANPMDQNPLIPSFNLITFLQVLCPNTVTQGLGCQHMNGGGQFSSQETLTGQVSLGEKERKFQLWGTDHFVSLYSACGFLC